MTYVVSDIHGNIRRFNSIMDQIGLHSNDTLFVLGDVIDRHPCGLEILQTIRKMETAKLLLGNHEYMMLNAAAPSGFKLPWGRPDRDWAYYLWLCNGGRSTMNDLQSLDKNEQLQICTWLSGLTTSYDIIVNGRAFKLVHASPPELYNKKESVYESRIEYSVWNRMSDYSQVPRGYTLVFGHTPTAQFQTGRVLSIWKTENAIGIDCGSGFADRPSKRFPFQGRLSCLRLDDMAEFYSDEEQT